MSEPKTSLSYERVRLELDRSAAALLPTQSGQVELYEVSDRVIRIRFIGHCSSCLSASEQLREALELELRKALDCPELEVRIHQSVSEELLNEARRILQRSHESTPLS